MFVHNFQNLAATFLVCWPIFDSFAFQTTTTGSLTQTTTTTPFTTRAGSLMRTAPVWTDIPSFSPDILTGSGLKTRRGWHRRNRTSASWANTDALHTLVRLFNLMNCCSYYYHAYAVLIRRDKWFVFNFFIVQVSVRLPKPLHQGASDYIICPFIFVADV